MIQTFCTKECAEKWGKHGDSEDFEEQAKYLGITTEEYEGIAEAINQLSPEVCEMYNIIARMLPDRTCAIEMTKSEA